jgi:hypothetical protein
MEEQGEKSGRIAGRSQFPLCCCTLSLDALDVTEQNTPMQNNREGCFL